MTFYDTIADEYDEMWLSPSDLEENRIVRDYLVDLFPYTPDTLDVGCGTGLLLELGVTRPDLYVGIDPSEKMLARLRSKYPDAETWHGTVLDWPPSRKDLAVALFAAASYLTMREVRTMRYLADVTVLMTYEPGYLPDYYDQPEHRAAVMRRCEAQREAISETGAGHFTVGRFDVWTLR